MYIYIYIILALALAPALALALSLVRSLSLSLTRYLSRALALSLCIPALRRSTPRSHLLIQTILRGFPLQISLLPVTLFHSVALCC